MRIKYQLASGRVPGRVFQESPMAGTNSANEPGKNVRPGEKWEKPALRRLDAHLAETGKNKINDGAKKTNLS
jgi:hypothetical protein